MMKQERPSPLPEQARADKTVQQMAAGTSDVERWAQHMSLATQWDSRAERAAAHIPAGSRVLDLGCGAMALRHALKPGCTYVPADIVEREPGALVIDINKQEFPQGSYDWITFLGVLEYIHSPAWPLMRAHTAAPNLLLTYCVDVSSGSAISQRRGMGWVNDFDLTGMRTVLSESGWKIELETLDKQGAHNHQMMFVCHRA